MIFEPIRHANRPGGFYFLGIIAGWYSGPPPAPVLGSQLFIATQGASGDTYSQSGSGDVYTQASDDDDFTQGGGIA